MRAARGHIAWSSVDVRLRALREIWVATASPRGRPDVTPVWFWWNGETVYFTCASHARKARNIAHEPEVVLHNGDGSDPIVIKGIAERVTAAEELARIDEAYSEKYVAPSTGERATIFVADDHVYRVRPRLVSAWSYADVATRTDWEWRRSHASS